MAAPFTLSITLRGETDPVDVQVAAALIAGEIGAVPVAHIDFASKDKAMDLETLVGTDGGLTLTGESGAKQQFWGTVISAEARGVTDGMGRYLVELRPWPWFLTRARNNRIFQDMTAMAIVKEVLSAHGFSRDLVVNPTQTDATRVYCTQYRESDFDFVARLIAEEGYYFYFDHGTDGVRMVVTDQASAHVSATADDVVPFRGQMGAGRIEHLHSWTAAERVVTGKVTLRDYDFENPTADLTVRATQTTGAHGHKDYDAYRYPGLYTDAGAGDSKAAAMGETEAADFRTWRGAGDTILLFPGKLFTLKDHPRHTTADASAFLATQVSLFYRSDAHPKPGAESVLQDLHTPAPDAGEHVVMSCTAVPKAQPYRAPFVPPRPQIAGIQTAIVTAPNGEEIDVDKYGRIHVRFHWDMAKKSGAAATCWVRTMMPWTGKAWGMAAWPRAGQEVVIQFEEGNPDRPLCTGMLYNADTMPPYPLPGQSTRSGMKTNSSKGGGGYNELMFEDKKGKELIRMEAERDFTQVVQNAAHLRVGYKHDGDVTDAKAQDARSMKLEVENHLDEIVETGDHSFTVKTGSQTLAIKTDKTETVEGKSDLTVTGDTAVTIKMGNLTETIDTGNVTRKLSVGNEKLTLSAGNYTMNAQAGKVDITAAQSITLTVGSSSIKIDQSGVTIKGMKVSLEGMMALEAKAPMTEVKADVTLILKGSMTMIN